MRCLGVEQIFKPEGLSDHSPIHVSLLADKPKQKDLLNTANEECLPTMQKTLLHWDGKDKWKGVKCIKL